MSFYIDLCLILTLPYHTGKACYRITPRPPVDQCVLLFHHKWYPVIKDRSVPVNVVPIMYTSAYYQCHRQALTICMTRWPSSSHSRSLLCVNICILKFVPITIDIIVTNLLTHFYRAMLCIARTMLWQDVRLSVRLSCVQTAKSIVNILSPPDSSIILVFYERSEIRRSL